HAGPEIGVASTKAFTTQLIALYLLALQLAQSRGSLPADEIARHVRQLREIPDQINRILEQGNDMAVLAERFRNSKKFLYLCRGVYYPIVLEVSQILKESAYIY